MAGKKGANKIKVKVSDDIPALAQLREVEAFYLKIFKNHVFLVQKIPALSLAHLYLKPPQKKEKKIYSNIYHLQNVYRASFFMGQSAFWFQESLTHLFKADSVNLYGRLKVLFSLSRRSIHPTGAGGYFRALQLERLILRNIFQNPAQLERRLVALPGPLSSLNPTPQEKSGSTSFHYDQSALAKLGAMSAKELQGFFEDVQKQSGVKSKTQNLKGRATIPKELDLSAHVSQRLNRFSFLSKELIRVMQGVKVKEQTSRQETLKPGVSPQGGALQLHDLSTQRENPGAKQQEHSYLNKISELIAHTPIPALRQSYRHIARRLNSSLEAANSLPAQGKAQQVEEQGHRAGALQLELKSQTPAEIKDDAPLKHLLVRDLLESQNQEALMSDFQPAIDTLKPPVKSSMILRRKSMEPTPARIHVNLPAAAKRELSQNGVLPHTTQGDAPLQETKRAPMSYAPVVKGTSSSAQDSSFNEDFAQPGEASVSLNEGGETHTGLESIISTGELPSGQRTVKINETVVKTLQNITQNHIKNVFKKEVTSAIETIFYDKMEHRFYDMLDEKLSIEMERRG